MPSDREADVYALVVGAIVSQLRARHGLTQNELASRIGVAQPTMSRVERGQARPDAFELRGLADAFGMSTAQFTEIVDQAYARAERAAKAEVGVQAKGTKGEWWKTALAVVGGIGLAGLAGFAAAAALAGFESDTTKQNKKRNSGEFP